MKKKIYVASSWRNDFQPAIVVALQKAEHSVYDFRAEGFHWSDIDPYWKSWDPTALKVNLRHPLAEFGYRRDFNAMMWADTFVGVMPFGRSASMEMGWAAGQGKRTLLLLENEEPELMVKMFDNICCSLEEVLQKLRR